MAPWGYGARGDCSLGRVGAAGAVSPATVWASQTGSVTIIAAEGNADATYAAYRLFTADVKSVEGTGETEVGVGWDSAIDTDKQQAIVSELDALTDGAYTTWVNKKGDPTKAQNVLEFMSERISGSIDGKDANNQDLVGGGSFGMKFATWLVSESNIASVGEVGSREAYTGDEGYYLFVSSKPGAVVATSPIWVPVNADSPKSVFEKASVPTVDKTVDGQQAGDAQIGEALSFSVKATLPSNYASFETYAMKITDTPTNMVIKDGTVKVMSGKKDITDAAGVSVQVVEGGTGLTVAIENLKAADKDANATTEVVVTYEAELTASAEAAPGSNKNEVKYEFSNNPGSTGMGTATDTPVKVHAYQLDLAKKDKHTGVALDGAEFIIKNEQGKFYNPATKAWTFETEEEAKANPLVTSANGSVSVYGLDKGMFELTEVAAPKGYEVPAGDAARVTIQIRPTYENGDLTKLEASASGAMVDGSGQASSETGIVSVVATNDKNVFLAMTGAEGVGMAGAGVVALGLVWYAVRSRRERANQQ